MTDLDRLCVLMYQTLMHMENELDEQVQNRQHILAQMPTPRNKSRTRFTI